MPFDDTEKEELRRIEALEKDELKEDEHEDVIELALMLGRAILESGGEMQRTEYAIDRLCRAYGAVDTDTYATGTVIILTAEFENGNRTTRSVRVRKDSVDLRRLEALNALSRELCEKTPPLAEGAERLVAIVAARTATLWQEVTGVALGSFGMTVASMGTPLDGLVAAIAAAAVMLLSFYLSRLMNKFATTLLSSFLASMVCILLYAVGLGDNLPTMIIGEIMILIPGLTLTNAVRDMLCGDVTSGAVKFLQSLMVTLGLAIGISVALVAFGGLVSGVDVNAVPDGGPGGDFYPIVKTAAGVCGALGFSLYFHIDYKRIPLALANVFITMVTVNLMEYVGGVTEVFFRTIAAAAVVTLVSELLAIRLKAPAIVFLIPAVLPLIPGGDIYMTMSNMVYANYAEMAARLLTALKGCLGIGCGIVAVSVAVSVIRDKKYRLLTWKQ